MKYVVLYMCEGEGISKYFKSKKRAYEYAEDVDKTSSELFVTQIYVLSIIGNNQKLLKTFRC